MFRSHWILGQYTYNNKNNNQSGNTTGVCSKIRWDCADGRCKNGKKNKIEMNEKGNKNVEFMLHEKHTYTHCSPLTFHDEGLTSFEQTVFLSNWMNHLTVDKVWTINKSDTRILQQINWCTLIYLHHITTCLTNPESAEPVYCTHWAFMTSSVSRTVSYSRSHLCVNTLVKYMHLMAISYCSPNEPLRATLVCVSHCILMRMFSVLDETFKLRMVCLRLKSMVSNKNNNNIIEKLPILAYPKSSMWHYGDEWLLKRRQYSKWKTLNALA